LSEAFKVDLIDDLHPGRESVANTALEIVNNLVDRDGVAANKDHAYMEIAVDLGGSSEFEKLLLELATEQETMEYFAARIYMAGRLSVGLGTDPKAWSTTRNNLFEDRLEKI
jgi:hypothetical protein